MFVEHAESRLEVALAPEAYDLEKDLAAGLSVPQDVVGNEHAASCEIDDLGFALQLPRMVAARESVGEVSLFVGDVHALVGIMRDEAEVRAETKDGGSALCAPQELRFEGPALAQDKQGGTRPSGGRTCWRVVRRLNGPSSLMV